MKKLGKKILGIGLSAAMLATTLFTGGTTADAAGLKDLDGKVITKEGEYLATFLTSEYRGGGRNGFEIKFKYEPAKEGEDLDSAAKYSDTFEFLVFNQSWGGWECTPVGPSGYDLEKDITPEKDTVYTVKVPFSAIEKKLSSGEVQGINLQAGEIGTNKVTIESLTYTVGNQESGDVLIEGAWTKTGADADKEFGSMKVVSGLADVSVNPWNISVSGFSVKTFKKPMVAVTVDYADITKTIYPQAEILDTDYQPVKANYPQVSSDGEVTYLTYIPQDMTSMILAYDTCTVKKVQIFDEAENLSKPVTDLTNSDIISSMGAGWNLGNALDAIDADGIPSETAWGNPEVNKYLFKVVSGAKIKTVRIPVTWVSAVKVDGNSYTINEDEFARILGRVHEVVDMVIDYDMFAIINIQHDGGENVKGKWLDITASNQDGIRDAFADVWGRIAEEFKDYDQHLIFESMNEVMESGVYGEPQDTTWDNINELNQTFVNTVRDNGKGDDADVIDDDNSNKTRFLLMPGYNTDITQTVNGYTSGKFVLPTYDGKQDREMVSVHFYDPYQFTLEENGTATLPLTATTNITKKFELLNETFVQKGIPVVIGEFGAIDKNNYKAIGNYIKAVVDQAKKSKLGYAYWDNGYTGKNGMGLWNRYTYAESELGKTVIPLLP